MAAREPLKHRRRRARRIACVLGTIVATAASTTAWVILRRPKHTTKSYKAPKPVTYSEFEKQGPWVPLPDARRLLNVKHGAWILDKRDLPQLTKDMSKEAFSDARSRRPAVLRRLHAIDATRVHETRSGLVSFWILRPIGPI